MNRGRGSLLNVTAKESMDSLTSEGHSSFTILNDRIDENIDCSPGDVIANLYSARYVPSKLFERSTTERLVMASIRARLSPAKELVIFLST